MFASDATRPPSCQIVLKRLGFSQPAKWVALNIRNESANCEQDFWILALPEEVVPPPLLGPKQSHLIFGLIRFLSINLPASAALIERRRRSAFFGLRSRCNVSTIPSYSSSEIITTVRAF